MIHTLSFLFKNNIELFFRGDDKVSHVLDDFRRIFSNDNHYESTPDEKYQITLLHDQSAEITLDLTVIQSQLIREKNVEITCDFTKTNADQYYCYLMLISALFGAVAQHHGGGLIHGALGSLYGKGFLMAAPGGTGKSTASNRLPLPFLSHCDDTTLIVKDGGGHFQAHPFPTWSRFFCGDTQGSWLFNQPLPLRAIFHLSQSPADSLTDLTSAAQLSHCVAAYEQASRLLARKPNREGATDKNRLTAKPGINTKNNWFATGHDPEQQTSREIRMKWFENARQLIERIPGYKLNLSREGSFWELIQTKL